MTSAVHLEVEGVAGHCCPAGELEPEGASESLAMQWKLAMTRERNLKTSCVICIW